MDPGPGGSHQVREHSANQSAADYALRRASSDFEAQRAALMIHEKQEHCYLLEME
jgi:hypothetical protein